MIKLPNKLSKPHKRKQELRGQLQLGKLIETRSCSYLPPFDIIEKGLVGRAVESSVDAITTKTVM